jgi:hypothetical protein
MRGSPACEVTLGVSVLWRAAVAFVTATALAALLAWVLLSPPGLETGIRAAAALGGVGIVAIGASLWRLPTGTLRWDGACWSFAAASAPAAPPVAGDLDVALDLGAFMLLRLRTGGAAGRRRTRWLAAEQRALARQWQPLRCAAYSPRPGSAAVADSPASPE